MIKYISETLLHHMSEIDLPDYQEELTQIQRMVDEYEDFGIVLKEKIDYFSEGLKNYIDQALSESKNHIVEYVDNSIVTYNQKFKDQFERKQKLSQALEKISLILAQFELPSDLSEV
eukprot:NODE_34_length_36538_cov_0.612854.p29 type:complete len:117 gc:universal NODE_34_length_36538_cov_0.612854:7352-7002(-)